MTTVVFHKTGRGEVEGEDGTKVWLQWTHQPDGTSLFYKTTAGTAEVNVFPWANHICEDGEDVDVYLVRWPEWTGKRLFTEEEYMKLRSDLLAALPAMGSGTVTFKE